MPAANEPRGAKPGMIERNGGPNLSALGLADTMGKRCFIELQGLLVVSFTRLRCVATICKLPCGQR